MITTELISYIKKQISKNVSKDAIITKLIMAGWHLKDINEGFLYIENEPQAIIPESIPKEVPIDEEKNTDIEIFRQELTQTTEEKPEIIEKKNIETPKIWIPRVAPVIEKKQNEIQVSMPEIQKPVQKTEVVKKDEELIPNLKIKNTPIPPLPIIVKDVEQNLSNINKTETRKETKNSLARNLPKEAMLSSYPTDMLLADRRNEVIIKPKKRKFYKWIIFILVFFFALTAFWFFVNSDYSFNLIKKDPKVLLLNKSKILASLQAYKTETNIEISSPSFSSITMGLINGEAVPAFEKDSLSIDILGIINKNENNFSSDTFITAKSSILIDNIISSIKENGPDLFISSSSFDQFLKENNSSPDYIKINKNEMSLVPLLFKTDLLVSLNKLNLEKILANGLAPYVNNEILVEYNELINEAKIIEKGQENIKGIDTYHYSVNVDKKLLKKVFDKIIDNFTQNISQEDKNKLSIILASSQINSFEIWIGKGDNNIYQYSIDADIPLSKIIGFEDASIGDNKISLKWKTTFFDFNVINEISLPENFILMTDFFNDITEKKIKNEVITFEKIAASLYKKGNVYGTSSNKDGSCLNPTPGSLFSPIGHSKNKSEEISSISLLLKKILDEENDNAFCYATTKAWSFSVPILKNYTEGPEEIKYYFCLDNTGSKKDLIEPPQGVICE